MKTKRKVKYATTLLVPGLALALLISGCGAGGSEVAVGEYIGAPVTRGDLTSSISSSGAVEPVQQYDIASVVQGEILEDHLELGQDVNEGDLLYLIDTSDAQSNIEKSRVALERQRLSYTETLTEVENLTVVSPVAGTVTEVAVAVGDQAGNNALIATIVNSAQMKLTVPFNEPDAAQLSVGRQATIYLEETGEEFSGQVTRVGAGSYVGETGGRVSDVEVSFTNPGALKEGGTAAVTVGTYASQALGNVEYAEEKTVHCQSSGEVAELNVHVGDKVAVGDVLCLLTNNTAEVNVQTAALSLRDAELSLTNMQKQLNSYNITSPISGTIIAKSYKAGDVLDSNRTVLAVLADMSGLTFEMAIDELDISKLAVGQKVVVTADAAEGTVFDGEVQTIGLMGNSSNGVTTYPVEVLISTYEGLLPGMNVNAEIITGSAADVLLVPSAAVSRGNIAMVKTADATGEGMGEVVERPGTPEGYAYVRVEAGITDGTMVEIKSGLSEGVEVYYQPAATGSGDFSFSVMPGIGPMGGGGTTTVIREGGPGAGAAGSTGGGRPPGGG
jgi:HlyD family secretion protein